MNAANVWAFVHKCRAVCASRIEGIILPHGSQGTGRIKRSKIYCCDSIGRQMLLPERCDSVAFRGQMVLVDQWRHLLELEPVFRCQVEGKDFQ